MCKENEVITVVNQGEGAIYALIGMGRVPDRPRSMPNIFDDGIYVIYTNDGIVRIPRPEGLTMKEAIIKWAKEQLKEIGLEP